MIIFILKNLKMKFFIDNSFDRVISTKVPADSFLKLYRRINRPYVIHPCHKCRKGQKMVYTTF